MSSPWTLLTPLAITLMLLAISAPFVKKLLVTTTLTLAQQKTLALAIITPTALSIVPTLWAASAQYYATPTLLILLTQTLAPLVFFLVALLLNWSRAWQHTLLVAALQSSIAMIIIETFFLRNIVSNRFLPIELITSPFVQYGITLALLVILAFFLKRK